MIKLYFVVTDIEGNIVTQGLEFATELEACEYVNRSIADGTLEDDRYFIETIKEAVIWKR